MCRNNSLTEKLKFNVQRSIDPVRDSLSNIYTKNLLKPQNYYVQGIETRTLKRIRPYNSMRLCFYFLLLCHFYYCVTQLTLFLVEK